MSTTQVWMAPQRLLIKFLIDQIGRRDRNGLADRRPADQRVHDGK